jgi:hypothetical protein
VEIRRITRAGILCSYRIPRHQSLKLLENVLTWRHFRYEGALRDRSLDLEETTAPTRYTAVQNGPQGTFQSCIVLCAFVTQHTCPIPSRPLSPFFAKTGEAGKQITGAHVGCYTRQTLCIFVAPWDLAFYFLHAATRLRCSPSLTRLQVNNVIIAGNDENDF